MKKKFLFIIAALLTTAFFLKEKYIPLENSYAHEKYLSDYDFNFIAIYKETDRYFHQKIESMLNQTYENYEIYVFIDKDHPLEVDKLKLNAKKAGKAHLLNIIEIDQNAPISLLIKDATAQMKKGSILVLLEENCMFTDPLTLKELNNIYKKSLSPLLIYANFMNFPTFLKNTRSLDYKSSNFKTIYTDNFRNSTLDESTTGDIHQAFVSIGESLSIKTHCIKEPFYLHAR